MSRRTQLLVQQAQAGEQEPVVHIQPGEPSPKKRRRNKRRKAGRHA